MRRASFLRVMSSVYPLNLGIRTRFSGCSLRFSFTVSTTIIFLRSLLRYRKSLMNSPFLHTILSLPRAPWMYMCRGSIRSMVFMMMCRSSSPKMTTSYFLARLFRRFSTPGRSVYLCPFPNTYSDLIRVPLRLKTMVWGWKSGWTTS